MNSVRTSPDRSVAVIGMAGRFPGAADVDEFWKNIAEGRNCLTHLTRERLRRAGVPDGWLTDPDYVPMASALEDADCFDAGLFGFSPREAGLLDPQQRLFLELAWTALEHAGRLGARGGQNRIGVFGGSGGTLSGYGPVIMSGGLPRYPAVTQEHLGNEKDFLASRVSYHLNLTGPSLTVQASCSTALTAAHLACRSLMDDECDAALVGAVSIRWPQHVGYFHREGGMQSRTGRVRPYDAASDGTVIGNGGGVIVLKLLADALRDGDTVYAVIRGTAINNDGGEKLGYASPSMSGILNAASRAMTVADVAPETIGYVETQGSATVLSDATEISALHRALGGTRCAIGSVKAAVGNLDVAAGIAALIKSVLAVHHGLIPPSPYFTAPHPRVHLDDGGLFVNPQPLPWTDAVRRAGVTSFSIGGANAFAVLESAPEPSRRSQPLPYEVISLSARTAGALRETASRWRDRLMAAESAEFPDLAYTAAVGRRRFGHRLSVVAASPAEAGARLGEWLDDRVYGEEAGAVDHGGAASGPPKIALAFPGEGGRFGGMAEELMSTCPAFRGFLDRMSTLFAELTGLSPQDALAAPDLVSRPELRQPALLLTELGLAEMWASWGVRPSAVIGYGLGEYGAAVVAGVLTPEDALRLVAARGRIATRLPLIAPAAGPLTEAARAFEHHAPGLAIASSVTGALARADTYEPGYWARHLTAPVRYDDGVSALVEAGVTVFVETGPGTTPTGLTASGPGAARLTWIPALPERAATWAAIQEALARLDRMGADVDWEAFYAPHTRRRIAAPSYPFERVPHWYAEGTVPSPRAEVAEADDDVAVRSSPALPARDRVRTVLANRLSRQAEPDATLVSLGLNSLAAVELRATLRAEFGADVSLVGLLGDLTPAALERVVSAAEREDGESPAGVEGPLSSGQHALWITHQTHPDGAAYNIAFAARYTGALDTAALRRALALLAERHMSLRTTFHDRDGEAFQRTHGELDPEFHVIDAVAWDGARLSSEADMLTARPFDLEAGPLVRLTLLTIGPEAGVLLLVVHHLVADMWSLDLMLDELAALYLAETGGPPAHFDDRAATYATHVRRQHKYLDSDDGHRARAYWHAELAGAPTTMAWPAFGREPGEDAGGASSIGFVLGPELTAKVRGLAGSAHATPFAVFLTGLQQLLRRYTGQADVLVGVPVSGRTDPDLWDCVGYFADPVVLRGDLRGRPSVREAVARNQRTVAEALEYQEYPFEALVRELAPSREAGRNPLFQCMFVYQEARRSPELAAIHAAGTGPVAEPVPWAGLGLRPFRVAQQEDQHDLSLVLFEDGENVLGTLRYRRSVFPDSAARRAVEDYLAILRATTGEPDTVVDDLVPEPGSGGSGGGSVVIADDDSIVARFAVAAATHASRPAVRCDGVEIDYGALDSLSSRWAAQLRGLGAGPGRRVALLLPPSVDTVVAVLAVLKSGAAYVPLDPMNPVRRLRGMIEDCGPVAVLTHQASVRGLEGIAPHVMAMDGAAPPPPRDPGPCLRAGDLAYTVYTSGSTGAPKGIDVEHRQVLGLLDAMRRHVAPDPEAVWTLFHSTAFDVSVWELWGALLSGACLVVIPGPIARDPERFLRLLVAERVTHLNQTPSALHGLDAAVERAGPAGLMVRHTFSCGELLPGPLALRSLAWCGELWNLYGPAEATVCVTARRVRPSDCAGNGVPVGHALDNATVTVRDAQRRELPKGIVGELYIGGSAVARGYAGRPELTVARFVTAPDDPGGRRYRTGDLAWVRADGQLEILGRIDNQVKVNGYRIELEEIEACLERDPAIAQAAVFVDGSGADDRRITACVVLAGGRSAEESTLRASLRTSLPEYMVPAAIEFVPTLPLTINQKVDRRLLAEQVSRSRPATARTAAAVAVRGRGEMEELVAEVWAEVLRRDTVRDDDNFFDLGGNSLLLLQVHRRLARAVAGRALTVADLFRYPTVSGLAARLSTGARALTAAGGGEGIDDLGVRRAEARHGAVSQGKQRAAARKAVREMADKDRMERLPDEETGIADGWGAGDG
ncbi:non-ribosomal peptide synthetase/type I polyketide synthase [Nonomuraea basaltis]|uniref:non-ribosomal peptide synthetase/type I polyketide synthase n=1 Tax=Nonomuraea basaltis TaxID=2495887 RepID=UPI00110C622D|nr:non-ribosomal peptide synthetase/type I polyketide synthase [Nonomuraea basaltis]TMR90872.1 amino acid adenylation domain-containing protein [Nonomuraea basaltis]